MNALSPAGLGLLLACLLASACASGGSAKRVEAAQEEPVPVVGVTSQVEILAQVPAWAGEMVLSSPEPDAAERLALPSPGVEIEIFFGSWCSDSRRELARLWHALDLVGGEAGVPIRYIGVDRSKREPTALVEGREILYVPTLIVSRDGLEVGRIVESSPGGVESDLADLIQGRTSGWVSGRDDLESQAAAGDSR